MLILAHALFRICNHADTSISGVCSAYPPFTKTSKNSSTTPSDRPRQFSQNLARLMACVASVLDRTSLNKLCINRCFISSVLSVLEVETLVECVEAPVCLLQCWSSGTSSVRACVYGRFRAPNILSPVFTTPIKLPHIIHHTHIVFHSLFCDCVNKQRLFHNSVNKLVFIVQLQSAGRYSCVVTF